MTTQIKSNTLDGVHPVVRDEIRAVKALRNYLGRSNINLYETKLLVEKLKSEVSS